LVRVIVCRRRRASVAGPGGDLPGGGRSPSSGFSFSFGSSFVVVVVGCRTSADCPSAQCSWAGDASPPALEERAHPEVKDRVLDRLARAVEPARLSSGLHVRERVRDPLLSAPERRHTVV